MGIMSTYLKNEFERGPVVFIMNAIQMVAILLGLFWGTLQLGVFKNRFETLEITVSKGFDRCDKRDKAIENSLIEHTGKPIKEY
jgi:hypothetical protein